ncbi:MAG: aminotransferase class I/II-fold pyridoxal phosphate-dependent enzyme [Candidatus Peribacteraceae bacterium]|nr:aminotransferase class I/II-fold pyridoxal phosphate-dependent enzyme [Candidatus Peribacteraceae bacterium]
MAVEYRTSDFCYTFLIPSFFSRLPPAPIDPIFAIAQKARAAGPGAIDATIGMIVGEEGGSFVLDCVRKAAFSCASIARDFSYPLLLGLPSFRAAVTTLIFEKASEHIASVAATGGTGAIAINLKLLQLLNVRNVVLPMPSWPNHRRLLSGFGVAVTETIYLEETIPSIAPLLNALKRATEPTALLLQACGHNPTGLDLPEQQWHDLAASLKDGEHVVLLDCAYQGLAHGTREDTLPARILAEAGVPLLVSWSASKNHTIYNLRTGLACAAVEDAATKEKIERHYMILIREMHSAAPIPGQEIVAAVQEYAKEEWMRELANVRALLAHKRSLLLEAFPRWAASLDGSGLYACLPLKKEDVLALRRQNIFLTDNGRMNIAGVPMKDIPTVIEKVLRITKNNN